MQAVLFEKLLPVVSEYPASAGSRATIALPTAFPYYIPSKINGEHKIIDGKFLVFTRKDKDNIDEIKCFEMR